MFTIKLENGVTLSQGDTIPQALSIPIGNNTVKQLKLIGIKKVSVFKDNVYFCDYYL